jgi:hypothetical protein
MDGVQNQAPIFNSPYYYDNALTAESMMVYLTTRLGSIDDQIQGLFTSQHQSEKLRAAINEIRTEVNQLKDSANKEDSLEGGEEVLARIEAIIDEQIAPLDPELAEAMKTDLQGSGHILHVTKDEGDENSVYTTLEIEKTREYLEGKASELESTAQMNMIHLQSLMSARQTAISLATNVIAKHDESLKKVVDNIR